MINKDNKQKNNGYTIIETMIAVSLFTIIVISGMGALLNANLLHSKSRNMRSIMDNMSFILDDMSRNLRTGSNYHCFVTGDPIPTVPASDISNGKSCGSGWGVAFESSGGDPASSDDQWVYYINNGKIFKAIHSPYTDQSDPASQFIQLNPDEVVISSVSSFTVLGAEHPPTNLQQPMVTIRLVGTITYKDITTPFSLQTSVSQRLIDL